MLCAIASAGCEQAPVDDSSLSTKVEFEQTTIAVDAEGGSYTVNYAIDNPMAGIDIVASTNAEWISDFKGEGGKLTFSVAPNPANSERSAFITVKYPTIENVRLEVTQAGYEGVTFQIEITDKTTTTCKSIITPSDPDTLYIVYMADLGYFYQSGIMTAEQLFEDDYNYFMGLAKEYEVEYIEEFLLMNEMAFKGESTIIWAQMTPETEYVLYVYAIEVNDTNSDYSLASPVAYTMLSLSSADLAEVEFDVTIDINGPETTYNIKPIDWDGKYYLDIYEEGEWMYRSEGSELDDDYIRTVTNTWMSMITIYMQSGYTAEQLMELMCLEGEDSFSETRKASTNYAMILYTIEMIDGLPQVASKPQLVNFRTGDVAQSDMILDIKVENNYVRVADVSVTPTTNDPYTVALLATDEIPDGSNEEIISWLTENFQLATFTGNIFSHVNTLDPETDYSILAFGYYGSTVTTDLFRVDFSTEAEGECLNSIVDVRWNAPYSLLELEQRFPDEYYNYGVFESKGWFAMWSEIETAEPTRDMFYCIYRVDRIAQDGEQSIFDDLVSYVCPEVQLLTGESDVLYAMCAVIMDYKGNYSEMWMSEPFRYTFSADTKLPIEELIAKLGLEGGEAKAARKSVLQPAKRL